MHGEERKKNAIYSKFFNSRKIAPDSSVYITILAYNLNKSRDN